MEAWGQLLSAILGGGLVASLVAWARTRKQDSAAGAVAQASVPFDINSKALDNAEKRLKLTQAAWDAERVSFEARIQRLEQELGEEREESTRKDRKIRELEQTVGDIQTKLLEVTRELASLRTGQ